MERRSSIRTAVALVLLGSVLGLHGTGEGKRPEGKQTPPNARQTAAAKLAQQAQRVRQDALHKPSAPSARRVQPQDLLLAKMSSQAQQRAAAKPVAKAALAPAAERERTALAKRVLQAQQKRQLVPAKPGAGPRAAAAKLAAPGRAAQQHVMVAKLASQARAARLAATKVPEASGRQAAVAKLAQQARLRQTSVPGKPPRALRGAAKIAVASADEDASSYPVVTVGQERTGALSPAGDTDTYALYGSAGQTVDVSLTSDTFDTYLEVEFGGAIIASDDDSGVGLNSLIETLVLPDAGDYLIHVSSYSGSEGAYTLLVSSVAATGGLTGPARAR